MSSCETRDGRPRPVFLVGVDGDPVLAAVAGACSRRGAEPRRMGAAEFAALVEVRLERGVVHLAPDGALMHRPERRGGDDEDFFRYEQRAQLESFAALSPRPVLNRHGRAAGALGAAVAAHALAPGLAGRLGARVPRERFVSDLADVDGDWDAQDLRTSLATRAMDAADPEGAHRVREPGAGAYSSVAVVQGRARPAVGVHLHTERLGRLSAEIVRSLGLDFGAVVWRHDTRSEGPAVARIDRSPGRWSLGEALEPVADELATFLLA